MQNYDGQKPRKVAVLGATGSIGESALSVIRASAGRFTPVLLTAKSRAEKLSALLAEFPAAHGILGEAGLCEAITHCGADIAINGIAGAAGLLPSIAALECGMDLALANKETVCLAWDIVKKAAQKSGAKIIPVDSEHSAIFSLINAHGRENVDSVILTCSGGPFRNMTQDALKNVTPQDALSHPTWSMGQKITVDSATLANKGLEVIEAARFFDMSAQKIEVTIHPESIAHSFARLKDGAVYAQLSKPDMRLPIHNALHYPEIAPCEFAALDFTNLALHFSAPDAQRFPMLSLAYEALAAGDFYTTAYNAANEEAVYAFLSGDITFTDIPRLVEKVLQSDFQGNPSSIEAIMDADKKARGLLTYYRST